MYKYHLSNVDWRQFSLSSIFDIKDGYYNKKPPVEGGRIPFLSATQYNNGISTFYTEEIILAYDKVGEKTSKDIDKRIYDGNCLTITNNGSVGNVYYQAEKFTCSHDVTPIYLKGYKLNSSLAKFLIPMLEQSGKSFEYAKKWRPKRMRKSSLLLPVDKQGNPNWHFMEEYIKERENKKRQDLKDYYKNRLLDLVISPEVLTDVEWKEIFIEEVAEIYSGKDIYEKERTIGDTPYITATANNNGIGYFIGNKNKTLESECISVNRNGSVGYAFYHCYEALYGNDTRKLKPFIKNKYTASFITHAITSQKDKYGYGYKMGTGRLKRQKIMLPVSDGEINYEYMENFIKNIEKKHIKNVLKYLDEYIYIYIIYNHFDNADWKEFFFDEICNINSGVRLTKANMQDGNIPFIGATDSNNGITNFVSNTNASHDKNVLGVNYNGSVVENFYHPYSCVFSDDVKRVSFKDEQGQNKYCYMFLKQMILQQKEKYRYAYKFNGDRMARQKVMMPVDELGDIDFKFMNRYIASKEMKNLVEILKDI